MKVDNTIQGWVEHDVNSERIAADEDQSCAPRIGCHCWFGQGMVLVASRNICDFLKKLLAADNRIRKSL